MIAAEGPSRRDDLLQAGRAKLKAYRDKKKKAQDEPSRGNLSLINATFPTVVTASTANDIFHEDQLNGHRQTIPSSQHLPLDEQQAGDINKSQHTSDEFLVAPPSENLSEALKHVPASAFSPFAQEDEDAGDSADTFFASPASQHENPALSFFGTAVNGAPGKDPTSSPKSTTRVQTKGHERPATLPADTYDFHPQQINRGHMSPEAREIPASLFGSSEDSSFFQRVQPQSPSSSLQIEDVGALPVHSTAEPISSPTSKNSGGFGDKYEEISLEDHSTGQKESTRRSLADVTSLFSSSSAAAAATPVLDFFSTVGQSLSEAVDNELEQAQKFERGKLNNGTHHQPQNPTLGGEGARDGKKGTFSTSASFRAKQPEFYRELTNADKASPDDSDEETEKRGTDAPVEKAPRGEANLNEIERTESKQPEQHVEVEKQNRGLQSQLVSSAKTLFSYATSTTSKIVKQQLGQDNTDRMGNQNSASDNTKSQPVLQQKQLGAMSAQAISNQDVSLLPYPWASSQDSHSGRTFYYNKITSFTSWDRPTPEQVTSTLPEGWIAYLDVSGRFYYLNQREQITTWDNPLEQAHRMNQQQEALKQTKQNTQPQLEDTRQVADDSGPSTTPTGEGIVREGSSMSNLDNKDTQQEAVINHPAVNKSASEDQTISSHSEPDPASTSENLSEPAVLRERKQVDDQPGSNNRQTGTHGELKAAVTTISPTKEERRVEEPSQVQEPSSLGSLQNGEEVFDRKTKIQMQNQSPVLFTDEDSTARDAFDKELENKYVRDKPVASAENLATNVGQSPGSNGQVGEANGSVATVEASTLSRKEGQGVAKDLQQNAALVELRAIESRHRAELKAAEGAALALRQALAEANEKVRQQQATLKRFRAEKLELVSSLSAQSEELLQFAKKDSLQQLEISRQREEHEKLSSEVERLRATDYSQKAEINHLRSILSAKAITYQPFKSSPRKPHSPRKTARDKGTNGQFTSNEFQLVPSQLQVPSMLSNPAVAVTATADSIERQERPLTVPETRAVDVQRAVAEPVMPSLSGATSERAAIVNKLNTGLPQHWEARLNEVGRAFYINHLNKSTSWDRPSDAMPLSPARRGPPVWVSNSADIATEIPSAASNSPRMLSPRASSSANQKPRFTEDIGTTSSHSQPLIQEAGDEVTGEEQNCVLQ